jgi:hypothetical protein
VSLEARDDGPMCKRESFAIVLGHIHGVLGGQGFVVLQYLDECMEWPPDSAHPGPGVFVGQMVPEQQKVVVEGMEDDSGLCGRHALAVWSAGCLEVPRTYFAVAVAVGTAAVAEGACPGIGCGGPALTGPFCCVVLGLNAFVDDGHVDEDSVSKFLPHGSTCMCRSINQRGGIVRTAISGTMSKQQRDFELRITSKCWLCSHFQ